MKRLVIIFAALALVLAACGTDSGTSNSEPFGDVAAAGDAEDPTVVGGQIDDDDDDTQPVEPDGADTGNGDVGADDEEVEGTETEDPTDVDAEESDVAPALTPEGPAVPDVTLELDDGTTFVLADAERPVMLVFWAEW